jgi:hypothetical protein
MTPAAPLSRPASPGIVRIAVGGLPYFGRKMTALLSGAGWQATYLETQGWQPGPALRAVWQARRSDLLYQLGGQIARLSRPHLLLMVAPRPCVMHWTGSDVTHARTVVERGRASGRLQDGCVHWAGAPWLAEELARIGVAAEWVPHSAVDAPAGIPDFPERFTVLAYLRTGRETFYGLSTVRAVAAALPEAQVLVAGCDRLPGVAPANIRCLGWVEDMASVYARSHVLLRMAEHDGLAFMVQEALALGRHAVWNHPFPGTLQAATEDEARARVSDLSERHRAGTLGPNLAGAEHIRERYSPARIRDDIRRRLAAIIEARS